MQPNPLNYALALLVTLGLLAGSAPAVLADDHDEVMDVVMRYAELEEDLEAQARLIRDDRVMITDRRISDQELNLRVQLANRASATMRGGGTARWITEIESPEVRVYGNTAVVSMIRSFHIYPPEAEPVHTTPHWLTLVLVREGGDWGIAHTHMSPMAQPG